MRIKVDVTVKPVYVKLFLAEIIALIGAFLLVFIISNYVLRVQVLGKYVYRMDVLPSIMVWLFMNVGAVSFYAGLKNLKFIFLQIGINVAIYLLLSLSMTKNIEEFIFFSTRKEILAILIANIVFMSVVSLLVRAKELIWRRFFP